jgi:hypothetical protein
MAIPIKTKNLIERFMAAVKNDPRHHLSGAKRFEIYESFGRSRFSRNPCPISSNYVRFLEEELKASTVADKTLGWLAVLTARRVLPIWDEYYDPEEYLDAQTAQEVAQYLPTPQEVLQVAEKVLKKQMDNSKAFELLCNKFNWPVEGSEKYNVASSYRAAHQALNTILSDSQFLGFLSKDEDNPEDVYEDFAAIAMQAYSFVDNGNNKTWLSTRNPEFDPSKCLEFWEWWLTEAIPEAWDLAQQV